MKRRDLFSILLLAAALLAANAFPCRAAGDLARIHKQAWRLDPRQGEAAPGHERAFEKNRKAFARFIDVYQVAKNPARVVTYLFQADDGFFVTNITAALSQGEDGWFILELPKLSPDADTIVHCRLKDPDTLLLRRASGIYVYNRVPDFTPPRDAFTGRNPLPWKE